jgi:hypothetical protein
MSSVTLYFECPSWAEYDGPGLALQPSRPDEYPPIRAQLLE